MHLRALRRDCSSLSFDTLISFSQWWVPEIRLPFGLLYSRIGIISLSRGSPSPVGSTRTLRGPGTRRRSGLKAGKHQQLNELSGDASPVAHKSVRSQTGTWAAARRARWGKSEYVDGAIRFTVFERIFKDFGLPAAIRTRRRCSLRQSQRPFRTFQTLRVMAALRDPDRTF